ncbi:MAG: hypothetical protein IJD73_04915 [Clostridia bacterium]|nr:hypothetical protein [Clostridia bacterium]
MKNKSNKKTNKKFRLGLFIKMSVAAMLLISMTISFSSGTAVAEFVKTFSANIDFEGIPSVPWSYYLEDANGTTTNGTYADYKSITQQISTSTTVTPDKVVYEIKMPVKGTGLYTVDFTVKFTGPSGWSGYVYSDASGNLNEPVGCKINTRGTTFTQDPTVLMSDAASKLAYNAQPVYGPDPRGEYASHKIINANGTTVDALNYGNYHDYQWKTLAPSRKENVSLTFYLPNDTNVAIWSWDLRGLGNKTYNSDTKVHGAYTLSLTNISIKKINDPATDEPYLDFADTHYVNNALHPVSSSSFGTGDTYLFQVKSGPDGTIRGKAEAGKTRTNVARGTYITEATYNSMTMQAEKLVFGYHNGNLVDATYMNGKAGKDANGKSLHERYSNLVSFGIPIKNVKAGKSYKITFDVGFARQGDADVENDRATYGYVDYASYGKIFATKDGGGTLHMESYLYRGIKSGTKIDGSAAAAPKTDYGLSQGFSIPFFTDTYFGRGNFYDPNKAVYNSVNMTAPGSNKKGNAVSRYNELWTVGTGTKGNPYYGITSNVNNLENISATYLLNQSNNKYNWYNAVYSTETNGQNTINWITFTNNTFTFSIDTDVATYYEGNIDQLRWIWALDGLQDKSWYRIKFDNVRIEEVVTYGSNVGNNGINFNGVNTGFKTYEDIGLFRGANGTGQNYHSRGATTLPLANMNVYAPIYDAKGKTVVDSSSNQRISLSGYAVCNGGVEKYVWSADGGETWYDMESQRLSDASAAVRLLAEEQAENSTIGLTGKQAIDATTKERVLWSNCKCDYATFTAADGVNGQFEITANLKGTPYAGKTGLNIIFAAVPFSNSSARLELIRITNYNS